MPYVTQQLAGRRRARSSPCRDYMRAGARTRSASGCPDDFASLGADGFGFSDTRPAARRFFHIDGPSIAVRALQLLAERGEVDADARRARRPSATGCSTSPPAPPATPAASPSRRRRGPTSGPARGTPSAGRQRDPLAAALRRSRAPLSTAYK